MPLPSLVKTWQFNVNQTIADSGAALTNNRELLRAIIASLKGFGTLPWTVRYSCDSVNAGTPGDGVDRWAANANLVWSAAGAASWIVLRQTGVGATFEILISLNSTSSTGVAINLLMSPSAAFGVGGGTAGSTTTRPTATDEVSLLSSAQWGGNNGAATKRLHVQQSTDGQCTRIVICETGVVTGFWLFDKPANVVTGWSNPCVALVLGVNAVTEQLTVANLITNASARGRGTATMNLYLTSEARGSAQLGQVFTIANAFSGEFPIFPLGLASETVSHVGRHGTLQDIWFGLSSLANGDTYPNDTTRQLLQAGELVLPWNGAVPAFS